MEKFLEQVREISKKYGFALPEKLQQEIAELNNPQYRIAVVGQYQVGKTTLINRVFLKNKPILLEGYGLATTSIGTETTYGANRIMTVFDNDGNCIKKIDDPSEADVREWTVGENRQELIEKVGKVCIYEPHEALQNYTIIDTPGVNDPDTGLLAKTTYSIIPGADVAILVVEPQTLDEIEVELLQQNFPGMFPRRILCLSWKNSSPPNWQKKKPVPSLPGKLSAV